MSATVELNSDGLYAQYLEEIRAWDWEHIEECFKKLAGDPNCYEDYGDGNRYVFLWLGTVFALTPSGKFYTFWTTNQTEEDVLRDSAWWEALETVAKQNGCFVSSPEWADGDGVYLCKRFDTPEEEDEDDDELS